LASLNGLSVRRIPSVPVELLVPPLVALDVGVLGVGVTGASPLEHANAPAASKPAAAREMNALYERISSSWTQNGIRTPQQ
jgi:hypothetical protein